MADRTAIPVVNATWNPVTGCSPVSRGCRRCYAKGFAKRLAGRYGYPGEDPFRPMLHPDRLGQPAGWRKARTIFVCSMGDIFHEDLTIQVVEEVFRAMSAAPHHLYTLLTKRPERMAEVMDHVRDTMPTAFNTLAPRIRMGVSVEDQACADTRLPVLVRAWPGLRLACCEPLLGPIDLSKWIRDLGWVITGGETGPGGQEAEAEHLRSLRDQCVAAGVPLFFKQWGGRNNKHRPSTIDGKTFAQLPGSSVL